MEERSNRSRRLSIRLSPEEYQKIETLSKASTCRKLSDYVRLCLFDKPVVATYRNQSLDDFMAEMSLLRTELNHIGNNFNQAVKRLHTMREVPEFRRWLATHEVDKMTLANKMDEIKMHIRKIAEEWLR